jgi:hypothetical protein
MAKGITVEGVRVNETMTLLKVMLCRPSQELLIARRTILNSDGIHYRSFHHNLLHSIAMSCPFYKGTNEVVR